MTTDREADPGSLPTLAAADAPGAAATVTVTGAADRPIVPDERPASAFEATADRFAEHGELGRGGMGRVADAFDRTLVRQVAIKSLLATDRWAIARFEREARITAQLEHPAIVPLYEAGRQADGTPYYVMRRVDGRPLDHAVRSASFDQRLALVPNLLAVCDAAAFAHARSIVHRDIKPSNILLGRFGETLLIDWGLARRLDDRDDSPDVAPGGEGLTQAGSIVGTPGFMSPEQSRGDPIDARSDVYALGATLFYTLAGEPPHEGTTSAGLIASVAAGQPPRWQRLPGGVPDDLRAIIAKALATDPAQRYADAGALAGDVRRFVTGNLVAAHRYSALARLRRFVRRHRVAITVAGAAVALVAAVVIVAVVRIANERDDANAARERATERADDLTIARARSLLETNPTLAVALVRPLAGSRRWRDVSDVLAAASARGVAWRLPGPMEIQRLGMSPDGEHGLAVGGDGQIWLYDLRARTGRAALDKVDVRHGAIVTWYDDAHLAVFEGTTAAVVDTRTGARRAIAIAAPAAGARAGAGVVYWVDTAHRAWRLDGDVPHEIAVGEDVRDLELSPDGKQLAVLGNTALWWVDAAGAVHQVLDERAARVAWDSNSTDLVVAAFRSGRIQRVRLADPPVWGPDDIGRNWPIQMLMSHGHFVMQSYSGAWFDRVAVAAYNDDKPAGLAMARDGVIAAARADGTIELLDRGYRHHLIAPGGRLDVIASRAGSRYLLAAAGPDLLMWDLDAVFPKRLENVGSMFGPSRAGPHHLLFPGPKHSSTWVDLWKLTTSLGPQVDFAIPVEPSPSGTRAMSIAGEIDVMTVGAAKAESVARDARIARFAGDHHIVVTGKDGHVALHDLDTRAVTQLAVGGARDAKANREVIGIAYDDGRFERIDRASGRRDVLHAARPALDLLGPDGRWWMTWGNQLVCWERDGRLVIHAGAPRPISNLFVADADHIAINTDDAGFVVDAARPGALQRTIRLGSSKMTLGIPDITVIAADDHLSVPSPDGGAMIVDGVTGAAWPVGQRGPAGTPKIAVDGSVLYEWRDTTLAVWPLAIARSQAATVALAAALSNAGTNDRGDAVSWPDQR